MALPFLKYDRTDKEVADEIKDLVRRFGLHSGWQILGSRCCTPEELDDAVMGATTRIVSDGWLWDRKSASVDISPLVAATVALWGLKTARTGRPRIVSLSAALEAAEE